MQLINFDKLNRKNKIYILLFVDFFLILLSFFFKLLF